MNETLWPREKKPESNAAPGVGGTPFVTLWLISSMLVHVTVVPTFTCSTSGLNRNPLMVKAVTDVPPVPEITAPVGATLGAVAARVAVATGAIVKVGAAVGALVGALVKVGAAVGALVGALVMVAAAVAAPVVAAGTAVAIAGTVLTTGAVVPAGAPVVPGEQAATNTMTGNKPANANLESNLIIGPLCRLCNHNHAVRVIGARPAAN